MKKIGLFIIGILISTSVFGQYKVTSCGFTSYKNMDLDAYSSTVLCGEYEGIYTQRRNEQTLNYIDAILNQIGLYRNFDILGCSTIDNAFATHIVEIATGAVYRFIIYDDLLFDEVTDKTKSDWGVFAILAHELGHHLNGHVIRGGGSQPDKELQADEFAGFALAKAGGDLNAAKAAFRAIMSEAGSTTHPPLNERLVALDKGWQRGMTGFQQAGAQKPLTAEQVLLANIIAVGGEAAIKKIKYMQQIKNVNYTSYLSQDGGFKARQELTFYKPNSYYLYTDQGDRTGQMVYMGQRIFRPQTSGEWTEDKVFSMRPVSTQANDVSYIEEYAMLVNNPPMKMGTKTIEGKEFYTIELPEETVLNEKFNQLKTIRKIRYYDSGTYLLSMVHTIETSSMGTNNYSTYYSDYRNTNGVLFPYKVEMVSEINGKKSAYSVTTFDKIITDVQLLPMNFIQLMRNLEVSGRSF